MQNNGWVCSTCKSFIPPDAIVCPNCGKPLQNKSPLGRFRAAKTSTKVAVSVIPIVALCLFCSVCVWLIPSSPRSATSGAIGTSVAVQATNTPSPIATIPPIPEPTPSSEPTATPAPTATSLPVVGMDVMVGDIRWKITEVQDLGQELTADNTYTEPKMTAGKWLKVSMEIENRTKDPKSFTTVDLIDSQERRFQIYNNTYQYINNELWCSTNQLQPNLPKSCQIIYELPADAAGFKLVVGDLVMFGAQEVQIDLGQ